VVADRRRGATGRHGQELLVHLAPTATVLSPDRRHSLSFDREGRLHLYFRDGKTFKRSLASEVHLRYRRGRRVRQRLAREQALDIFREAYGLAGTVRPTATGELLRRLDEEILGWTPKSLLSEQERFAAVYKPVSILPPDQYLAVVLQATEGCTWNACTFCSFYMDRPFAMKSPTAFRQHAEGVKKLVGRGLAMRRGIFLADGNALALSNRRLDPLLEIAHEVFPGRRLYGFVDLYTGERRTVDDWAHLAARGLERVYVGMETGLDELLAWVNKPGSGADLKKFVGCLKEAGLAIGLILMVGLGGRRYRQRHAEASLAVIADMALDARDLVYLSPFVEQPGSAYAQESRKTGLEAMSEDEIETDTERLARQIRAIGIRASRYDIREFVY
jgi:radical SAM superfamily enzyme YgiQ (UPF0313 family)